MRVDDVASTVRHALAAGIMRGRSRTSKLRPPTGAPFNLLLSAVGTSQMLLCSPLHPHAFEPSFL
jgi:hypothetical protein